MSIDYYSCNNCGETFPDCGDYVSCEGCGTKWCCDECAEEEDSLYFGNASAFRIFGLEMHRNLRVFGLEMCRNNGYFGLEMLISC